MNRRAWLLAGLAIAALAIGVWLLWRGQGRPWEARPAGPPARVPERNVLLVGLDGLDWDVADPLMAAGEMPNLSRLVRGGARARLRSVVPVLSPVVWTSVATGKQPAKHGIVDFLAQASDGSKVPVTSTLWQARSLWDILSQSGIPVAVTAWWATWPAEPVRGLLATDRIAYQLFRDVVATQSADPAADARGKTYPPELYAEIRPLVARPAAMREAELAPFVDFQALGTPDADDRERLDELKTVLASTRTYEAIAARFLEKQPRGFHAVYIEATDTVAHLFMPFHPPRQEHVDARRFAAFQHAVNAIYREADAFLGRMLERVGPDWNVVVLSDHGFKHGENRPRTDPRVDKGPAADWHDRFGVLVLYGPDVRAGVEVADASVLDVAPTLLALYGLPVAEDMDGRVLEEALDPEFTRRCPLERTATYETGRPRKPGPALPSSQDADLVAKLRALGYLGGGGAPPADEGYELSGALATLNRGVALMAQGDLAAAEVELQQALEQGAGRLALVNLFELYVLRRDLPQARLMLERLERHFPESRELVGLRGVMADLEGKPAEAERLLRAAIAQDPAQARARVRLGRVLEKQGRLAEALAEYEAAVRADPNLAEARNYAGNIHRLQGRHAQAEAAYREAIAADPRYPGAYNNLGLMLQQRGELDEAVALYRKGLEYAPRSPLLHNSLATLLIVRKQWAEAQAEIEKALEIAPRMAEAHNNLGILLAQQGKTAEALAAFDRAVQADPGYAEGHFNRGKALSMLGREDEAFAAFVRASELAPRDADAALAAGELAYRAGRHAEALRYLERAERLTPNHPRLRERLAELRSRVGAASSR